MTRNQFEIATPRTQDGGFTLAELLVSIFVLAIIIFVVEQLTINATAVTRTGNRHISTDTQARTVFDRMALDFAQMVKRMDADYYVKGIRFSPHATGRADGRHGTTSHPATDQPA